MLIWNTLSSLLASKPNPIQQPVRTSIRTPQANHLTRQGHCPTHSLEDQLSEEPPKSRANSGHCIVHQRAQNPAKHTSVPVLVPRFPGPCNQRTYDVVSPTNELALALGQASPIMGKDINSKTPRSCSQRPQDQDLLTGEPVLDSGSPGPQS